MLTTRFEDALVFAFRLHAGQTRKGRAIPYMAHLMAVTALVLEHGGDEDVAIAALLHDAVEDQGGLPVLDEIRSRYGEHVALIVAGCTDAYEIPKPPWRARKEAYLQHLHSASDEVRLVSLADKLHNAGAILEDVRREGQTTMERFRGGVEGTLWYYHSLEVIFRERASSPMLDELAKINLEMEQLLHPAER